MAEILSLDESAVARERAVEALREGELVVLPVDTAYAVVADAFQPVATRTLARAKRRSRMAVVSVLIRSPRQVTGLVADIPETAERLMAAYWPGPLTLVYRAVDGLTWDLGQTHETVSLRIPTDDLTLEVIAEIGPLAASTANVRGDRRPETVEAAHRQLGDLVAVYVDGGHRPPAVSTIVDVTGGGADVVRDGVVPHEAVRAVATGEVPWGQRPAEAQGRSVPPGDQGGV